MVDIGKAAKIREREIRSNISKDLNEAEFKQLVEKIKFGNIHEVLAMVKPGDLQDFFSKQYLDFKAQVIQDVDVKSFEGSVPEPRADQFLIHHQNTKISPGEAEILKSMVGKASASSKFMSFKGGKAVEDNKPMTADEIDSLAGNVLDEADQFTGELMNRILDNQMMQEYRTRSQDVDNELRKIISMAKSGKIGVEFVIIALARTTATKNGVLMSWLGKKAFNVNDSLNKVAQGLHTLNVGDPRYASELQMGQSKTRDGSYQLQMLTSDIQKTMQNIESVMEFAKGFNDELFRTRREMIQKLPTH